MFVKIFQQILDSSIANNAKLRRMFMDMLVLADLDGVVDMTHEAISRRIGVPLDEVMWAIGELMKPDLADRSGKKNGARLVFIDPGREWGWKIVNYHHYRGLKDEASRRAYRRQWMRDYRKRQRQKGAKPDPKVVDKASHPARRHAHQSHSRERCEQSGVTVPAAHSEKREQTVMSVNGCGHACTQAEAEANVPPSVPLKWGPRGVLDFQKAKFLLHALFRREKRVWSAEEDRLLRDNLPISVQDAELIWTWFRLPPSHAVFEQTKRKQELTTFLRDFNGELDKIRRFAHLLRQHATEPQKADPPLWREVLKWKYDPNVRLPARFWELDDNLRQVYFNGVDEFIKEVHP